MSEGMGDLGKEIDVVIVEPLVEPVPVREPQPVPVREPQPVEVPEPVGV